METEEGRTIEVDREGARRGMEMENERGGGGGRRGKRERGGTRGRAAERLCE